MKKLAYLIVFIFTSTLLISCGGTSSSCVSSERYQIKNIKFENQDIVITKDFLVDDEIN